MKKNKKPTFKLDDDLLQLMDDASEVSGTSEISDKHTIAKEEAVIEFEITEDDDEIKISLKTLINNANITNQQIYDIKGQRNGYNMIYSLDKKGQLGIDRIKAWAKILHKKPVLIFVDMSEEEAKIADKELAAEKLENSKKNK